MVSILSLKVYPNWAKTFRHTGLLLIVFVRLVEMEEFYRTPPEWIFRGQKTTIG